MGYLHSLVLKKRFDIGILGGGQLGHLLINEGRPWGLNFRVLDPNERAPCASLGHDFLCASLDDPAALRSMAESCHSLTIEIEQVGAETLVALEKEGHRIIPRPSTLCQLQDKGIQKLFFKEKGFPSADFALVSPTEDLKSYASLFPAMAKLCKAGYDGRGVERLSQDFFSAPSAVYDAPYYLERCVDIQKELAVIVVRDEEKNIRVYEPVEMVFHEANLLDYLITPATIPSALRTEIIDMAKALVSSLDYLGVLAIEFFWTKEGKLLINELAPRVHNSGHHSYHAHESSQFSQLLRVLQQWPLASVGLQSPAALINIIGPLGKTGSPRYQGLPEILGMKGCHVYLYGKYESRPQRKLGHITLVASTRTDLEKQIAWVKKTLSVEVVPFL